MKKIKLLSLSIPVILTSTVVPAYLTSCSNKKDNDDSKSKLVKINMGKTTNLTNGELESYNTAACAINTDPLHIATLTITVPTTTNVVLQYNTGTIIYSPESTVEEIRWDTTEVEEEEVIDWKTATDQTQIEISYLKPIRFRAYNKTNLGEFSKEGENNYFQFSFDGGKAMEPGKGIRLCGSLMSLLCDASTITSEEWKATPDLTDASTYAFNNLFYASSAIREVTPNFLPFQTMKKACYQNLFGDCYYLTEAPLLPSTSLAESCYEGMFQTCTEMSTAPFLPAKAIKTNCYKNMFKDCSSLSNISLSYVGNFATGAFEEWVEGVNTSGSIFYDGLDTEKSSNALPENFTVISRETTDPQWIKDNTFDIEIKDDSSISEEQTSVVTGKKKIRVYKTATWGDIGGDATESSDIPQQLPTIECSKTTSIGKSWCNSANKSLAITSSTKISELELSDDHVLIPTYQFKPVIEEELVDIVVTAPLTLSCPKLATGAEVYYSIDGGEKWTQITKTSQTVNIPANTNLLLKGKIASTSVVNYTNIKLEGEGCASLNGNAMAMLDGGKSERTDLKEGEEFAFYGLFAGSTAIKSVPKDFLPSSVITKCCYTRMFEDCSYLENAPELNAITLAPGCYGNMFCGCSKLKEAPELPATELCDVFYDEVNSYYYGQYEAMFSGCSSMTKGPTVLPATKATRTCYLVMFENCTSLQYAPEIKLETDDTEYIYETLGYCGSCSEMFSGCTALTGQIKDKDGNIKTLELKLKDLKVATYRKMFYNCTNLQYAPIMNITSVDEQSCYRMFASDSGNKALTDATNINVNISKFATYCFNNMFTNCKALTKPVIINSGTSEVDINNSSSSCYRMYLNCSSLNVNTKSGTPFFKTGSSTTGITQMFNGTKSSISVSKNTTYYF